MTTISRTVTVDRPVDKVAAYLSDFSTSAEWDPHTVSCRRLNDGPVAVGARFENVQTLMGRQSALTYEVTHYEPGHRIVLEGGSETVHTRDEMIFAATADAGTAVTYTVDVELRGLATAGRPMLPAVMKKIADEGAAGLRQRLLQI
jgi:carbon monoxide dehydrogenase subunit G